MPEQELAIHQIIKLHKQGDQVEAGERRESFLARAWSGRIPLWQALLIVNFGGLIAVFVIALSIGLISFGLWQAGLLWFNVSPLLIRVTYVVLICALAVFSARCIWLSANNPRGLVRHALARMWACIFVVYAVTLLVRAFVAPLVTS